MRAGEAYQRLRVPIGMKQFERTCHLPAEKKLEGGRSVQSLENNKKGKNEGKAKSN
jgi:hypothetical protein